MSLRKFNAMPNVTVEKVGREIGKGIVKRLGKLEQSKGYVPVNQRKI